MSLSVPDTADVAGKTTFVQEAVTHADALGAHHVPTSMAVAQSDIQELKTYYARPRLISQGILPNDVIGRHWFETLTPAEIFSELAPGGLSKLTGVFGLRYTLVFTLQAAATPFHQGLLGLSWQYGLGEAYQRAANSATCTNIPHVRLDLSADTMVVLRVPFMYYTDFVLKSAIGSEQRYGSISLNTILPVPTVSGIVAPTYKLYMHIEDMEFIGVSPNTTNAFVVTPQAGRRVGGKFEREQEAVYNGPVSGKLSWVASGIPSLISIAGKAQWFLNKAAGAIASFGFSKPTVAEPPTRVICTNTIQEHNVDLPSQALVVAPTAQNHLAVGTEFSQTDVDEMAFAYILTQYSQICVGSIAASNPHATLIYATPVSPHCFWYRRPTSAPYLNLPLDNRVDTSLATFLPSHSFYLGSMFRFWRGGFKFRFTFAKTKMHGGRVLVSYVPHPTFGNNRYGDDWDGVIRTPEVNSVGLQPTGYTAVFDLKDSNVFEFEVPYSGVSPYMRFFDAIGSLSMIIMDPLQAPSVVNDSIDFLVEVACTPDFELACAVGPQYTVAEAFSAEPQSGKVVSTYTSEASQFTIGESLASVKQLIMMPKDTKLYYGEGRWDVDIMPWWYQPPLGVLQPPTSLPGQAFSFGGNLACCYCFVRGGTDVHVYFNDTQDVQLGASVYLRDFTDTNGDERVSNAPRVFSDKSSLHVRCPSYQLVPRMSPKVFSTRIWNPRFNTTAPFGGRDQQLINYGFDNPGETFEWYGPTVLPRVRLTNNFATPRYVFLRRCAADDAMLAHYMGPPPCIYTELKDPDFETLERASTFEP